jgi:hypothetical protein
MAVEHHPVAGAYTEDSRKPNDQSPVIRIGQGVQNDGCLASRKPFLPRISSTRKTVSEALALFVEDSTDLIFILFKDGLILK